MEQSEYRSAKAHYFFTFSRAKPKYRPFIQLIGDEKQIRNN